MARITTLIIAALTALLLGNAASAQTIVRKKDRTPVDSIEQVVIAGDTVNVVLPQKNLGRFDRGLFNYIFIPKGKWAFGITASYGELRTEDVQVLSLLKDLDFEGKMYSIKPTVAYFFAQNQSVGLKFDYNRGVADLANFGIDFDEDLSFSIRDVSYYQQSFSAGVFYRAYVGLDANGRFGVFNETDLSFGTGSSRFRRIYNDEPKDTRTIVTQGTLNFSPGVCVFLQENVGFQVSFGVFGLKWRKESQTTDGVYEGSRATSGANFRFNIFNINFGLMVVI